MRKACENMALANLLVLTIWGNPLHGDELAKIQQLLGEESSIRAVAFDCRVPTISYVATGLTTGDANGASNAGLQVSRFDGDGILLTGHVSIAALETDLDRLKALIERTVGPHAGLAEIVPRRFALWLVHGEQVVCIRPDSAGRTKRVPVHVLLPSELGPGKTSLIARISWREKLPPLGVRVVIDWSSIRNSISSRKMLNQRDLKSLTDTAIDKTWVQLESRGQPLSNESMAQVKQIVSARISQTLLELKPPRSAGSDSEERLQKPGKETFQWSLFYHVKSATQINVVETSFDLHDAVFVDRTIEILHPIRIVDSSH